MLAVSLVGSSGPGALAVGTQTGLGKACLNLRQSDTKVSKPVHHILNGKSGESGLNLLLTI